MVREIVTPMFPTQKRIDDLDHHFKGLGLPKYH